MSISWSWKESAVSAKRRSSGMQEEEQTEHCMVSRKKGSCREEEKQREKERERARERLNSDSRSTPSIALIYACYMPGAQRGRGTIVDTCLSVVNRIRLRCRSGNLLRWALASFCHAVKRAVQLSGRPADRDRRSHCHNE